MNDQKRGVWLGLAVIGAIAPIALLGVFIADHGLGDVIDGVFGNAAAAAVLADVAISSLVFWVWLWREAPRLGVSPWPYMAANVLVGLSFALPLFLYRRSGLVTRQA
jgi:spore maturation protein SpmA